MKSGRTRLCAAVLVLCLGLLLTVLFRKGLHARAEEVPKAVTRVTAVFPHENDGYWELIQRGLKEAEDEIGESCGIDLKVVYPQFNYSIAQMTELVKQETAAQADVLILQGNEDEDYIRAVRAAWEQGMKIICMDTDFRDFPEHLYVGTDNYEAGRMLGEKLCELADGPITAAVISGDEPYLNLEERIRGLEDVLGEHEDISLSGVYYNHFDGLTAMRLYRELQGQVDALIFVEGTSGTTMTAGTRGEDDYRFVLGFDAYDNVKNGVLDGIILQDTDQMGRLIISEIAHYISEGHYTSDRIYTDSILLSADNYDEVIG